MTIGGLAVVAFWRSPHGPLGSGPPRPVTHKEERGKKGRKGRFNIFATAGLRTQSAPVDDDFWPSVNAVFVWVFFFFFFFLYKHSIAKERSTMLSQICFMKFTQSVESVLENLLKHHRIFETGLYIVPARRPEAGNFWFGLVTFQAYKPGWLVRIWSALTVIQLLGF